MRLTPEARRASRNRLVISAPEKPAAYVLQLTGGQ